jgi:hypothetical protein
MKAKSILCLAVVLSGLSVFALASSFQIRPGNPHPDIRIQSRAGIYQVVLLPTTNWVPEQLEGRLFLRDGDKQLASCPVAGVVVTKALIRSPLGEAYRKLPVGAKVFGFEVATNLLASSTFSFDYEGGSNDQWFYLKDF